MTILFAVVSVHRTSGDATTLAVLHDSMQAQRLANNLNDTVGTSRCAVIPFSTQVEKNEKEAND